MRTVRFNQVSDSLVNKNNKSTLAANAIFEECVFLVLLTATSGSLLGS